MTEEQRPDAEADDGGSTPTGPVSEPVSPEQRNPAVSGASAGTEDDVTPPNPKEGAPPTGAAKRAGIKDAQTIDEVLRYAFARAGRFSIRPSVRDAITRDDTSIIDLRSEIEALAAQDPLLKVPVRLLAAVDRADGPLKFRMRCLSAVAMALLSNEAVRSVTGLDTALLYRDQGDPRALLDATARTLQQTELGMGPEGKPMKAVERQERYENGTTAVAYYFALQREWSDLELAAHLDPVLWADGYRAARSAKRESTRALLTEAAPGALGTVSRTWRSAVEGAEDRARQSDRMRVLSDEERTRALDAQRNAEESAAQLTSVVDARNEVISQLQARIAEEKQARHVQSSHAVDDYESLRTRMLRSIERQVALLEDGLHALRSGSTQVTEEYLERVIEAFVRQAESLRDEATSEGSTR